MPKPQHAAGLVEVEANVCEANVTPQPQRAKPTIKGLLCRPFPFTARLELLDRPEAKAEGKSAEKTKA
jgi:hypothetical protein